MRIKFLAWGVAAIVVLAVGLHLFGPEVMKEIHGGKLWPW